MTKMISDKEKVLDILRNNEITIVFEKADGSMREMKSTLMEKALINAEKKQYPNGKPPVDPDKPKRKPNPDMCSVIDVDQLNDPDSKNPWRGFRWDRLRKVGKQEFVMKEE